ncbi:PIG-L deacetylase family protein [Spirillospora sp. NBC_01491]|uniref:PIG-L deacetylase family protein n=1 Tax=Spirillospora sp. NBC_01491 TaxID=2976007 RepID=UPI002E324969|nr:PIG-L family deacetylase [Spirillospora sp. NBC_01491]
MQQPPLPVPDATGIYGFPDDLLQAHRVWQDWLSARQRAGNDTLIELEAPHTGARFLIEERRPSGRPVVAIEPHHDDLALSAGGLFLTRPVPLTVITVFTRSASVHPDLEPEHSSVEMVSALREAEARQALRPLRATAHLLGHKDADPPYRRYCEADVGELVDELASILADHGDAELIAPAGVTRHPDHLLVHEAARRVGCRWFWDDVAFWPTYALSADDRHLFDARVGQTLTPELTDITGVLLDKLTLLYMHGSQMQPLRAMYRPLRYAWTIAAQLPGRQHRADAAVFGERLYRLRPST